MARKTVEETELTRNKLIEAGARMFARYGYAYSTLDDIAQCAGLSRGAVYWHFKGKGELLLLILADSQLPLEHFHVPGTGLIDGFEQLTRALVNTLSVRAFRDLYTILLKEGDAASGECPVAARWQCLQDRLKTQLESLLAGVVGEGMMGSPGRAQALAYVMQLSITGLLFESLTSGQAAQVLAERLVSALLALLG